MCGGVAGQDYRLCCVLKVCAYSRHRIQSSSQALRPGMDIVRCGNTIDIESRLWSTTILFFHHVEKCWYELAKFRNRRKRKKGRVRELYGVSFHVQCDVCKRTGQNLNQYQACLYLIECISHGDSKYSHQNVDIFENVVKL